MTSEGRKWHLWQRLLDDIAAVVVVDVDVSSSGKPSSFPVADLLARVLPSRLATPAGRRKDMTGAFSASSRACRQKEEGRH